MSVNSAGNPGEIIPRLDLRDPLPATPAGRLTGDSVRRFIDPGTIEQVMEPVPVTLAPRVVSQTVAAGLIVPQGTTVNLVVAPNNSILGSDFVGVHSGFAEMNIADIHTTILNDSAVRTAVHQNTPLTDAQREAIKLALTGKNIEIVDTDPNKTFDRAWETLLNASLFE